MCRSSSQKRETFESSRGASTSSKMQIGDGFVRKTEKIMASPVRACSPPDKRDKDCSFLPGGLAKISRPAVKGSSELISFNSAFPPPNNVLNNSLNSAFTLVKLSNSLWRASLFNSDIALRSFAIACSRSFLSTSNLANFSWISSISISARRFTGPK